MDDHLPDALSGPAWTEPHELLIAPNVSVAEVLAMAEELDRQGAHRWAQIVRELSLRAVHLPADYALDPNVPVGEAIRELLARGTGNRP